MFISNYKRLSYAGIALWAGVIICEAMLSTDDSGIHIDFGTGITVLWGALHLLLLIFFLLPLYYTRSFSHSLFICILITGILSVIIPSFSAWETVTRLFNPPQTSFWSELDPFKISSFRKQMNQFIDILFMCLFICQVIIIILTFKIRMLKPAMEIQKEADK